MSAHWWWTWSIGLPTTAYAKSQWGPTSLTSVKTDNATNLNSPNPGSGAPGEEFNLRLTGTASVLSPPFDTGSVSQGWLVFRWNGNGNTLDTSVIARIVECMDGGTTTIIRLAAASSGNPATLNLFVNGTLVGTTTNTFGDAPEVVAIDFDLTQTPPQAGLVMSGVREITRAGGSGVPTTFDRIRLGSGFTVPQFAYLGDVALFDSLTDLTASTSQDVWVTYMKPDAVTDGDNSWSPTGGTDTQVISDRNVTTYTETVTDPDSLGITFESTSDRYATWFPTLIYGVAGVAYGVADVIHTTTIELSDDAGIATSTTDTLNAVGRFIGTWSPLNSSGSAWTLFNLNSASATYAVSS